MAARRRGKVLCPVTATLSVPRQHVVAQLTFPGRSPWRQACVVAGQIGSFVDAGTLLAVNIGMINVMCPQLPGLRVLLVEDVPSLRHAVSLMLESERAEVTEAMTGRQAVGLACAKPCDVVLTDLGLPDMSGGAVVTRLRSASPAHIGIAVVSGASEQDLARALEVGAERAFRKPVDWNALLEYLAGKLRVEKAAS